MKHNGVVLGNNSPLLTPAGARRLLTRTEEDDQVALFELLVGKARRGEDRRPGDGLTAKFPELDLIYAIPNSGSGKSRGMAGRMKAAGALRGMCDFCLPVMRGPFLSLYVEMKRVGEKSRPEQRRVQARLRAEGHCVVECIGVVEALDAITGYLALPRNRVSARPIANSPVYSSSTTLAERIVQWRTLCYVTLDPRAK